MFGHYCSLFLFYFFYLKFSTGSSITEGDYSTPSSPVTDKTEPSTPILLTTLSKGKKQSDTTCVPPVVQEQKCPCPASLHKAPSGAQNVPELQTGGQETILGIFVCLSHASAPPQHILVVPVGERKLNYAEHGSSYSSVLIVLQCVCSCPTCSSFSYSGIYFVRHFASF